MAFEGMGNPQKNYGTAISRRLFVFGKGETKLNAQEFGKQIDRLKSVFGEKSYPNERTQVIWGEVKHIDRDDFEKMVSDLIGSCRLPPLIAEFRGKMSEYRESAWAVEKKQYADEAKEAYRRLTSDEASLICQAIRGVILGSVTVHEADKAIECVYGLRN